MWNKKNIILASKSPRRRMILEEAGFIVEVITSDVDEDYPNNELTEEKIAEYLAIKKAGPFLNMELKDKILITADSIVVLDGIVYGKPDTKQDAINTLKALSDKVHKVFTGVCILTVNGKISFTEMAEIKFANLNEEEIECYIEKYQPYDKAGAYGIQDWIGLSKVEWIKGTFSNIMGLPMARLYKELMAI